MKKLLIPALLHLIFLAPLDLSSQVITGYSNIFKLGSQSVKLSPVFGYSGVFEMNTMGPRITGYSNLFELNTIGARIYGVISNIQTGQPLQNALVKTLGYTSLPSDAQGCYELYVPFGYGYNLAVLAENYETQYIGNIHVPEQTPEKEVDIQLVPVPLAFGLSSLDPDPNPSISEVKEGGKLHRFYKVVNTNSGNPLPQLPVEVIGSGFAKTYFSNEAGMVDIAINSNNIGNGQPGQQTVFSIVTVGGTPLTTPVTFSCEVTQAEYEKYWNNYNYAKLGTNFMGIDLSAELERGAVTTLAGSSGFPGQTQYIDISRQGRAGIGVGFKIKSPGIKGELGSLKGGIGAEAGLGTKFMGITENNYRFDHEITSNWQAVAEYILIADGSYNSIDNAMIRLLSALEEAFAGQSTLNNAFVSDKVGIDVTVEASAEAFAGVEVSQNASIGAGANIGSEGHVTFQAENHYLSNEYEYNFGVSGKFAGSAGAGLKMDFDQNKKDDLEAMLNIWETEHKRGLEFSVIFDANNTNIIKRFELKFIKRNILSKNEEEITFSIDGAEALSAIAGMTGQIHEIVNSPGSASNITVNKSTFRQILDAVFDAIYDIQASPTGQANISYQRDLTKISHTTSFDISLDLSITALAMNIGGGIGFEQGKKMTVESGKWLYGRKYMNQEFTSGIPELPQSYQQVLQTIVDEVPLWLRLLIGTVNVILPWKEDQTFYLGNNGSYIIFPDNAFPPGLDSLHCSSWSWYGNNPSKTLDDVDQDKRYIFIQNKKDAEEAFGMQYGIGGFYQFDPYGTPLNDTCWLTIVYDQAEVDSLDESSLSMYWEDKTSHKWNFTGGILDTVNNTITAPITELSLFTLAPAMPYGTFGLNAAPDTIYADSVSVSLITSDTLYCNNLAPVTDGEKFTVSTDHGKIVTFDADTALDGIQVLALDHKISFEVVSSHIAGPAKVSAFSANGSANGSTGIFYYDTIPPAAPVISDATGGYSEAEVCWFHNLEPDLSGYKVYFDTDTLLPLNGIHTVYGEPSPVYTGTDTLKRVLGLFNDSTYYIAVSAVDVAGNESPLSDFVAVTPGSRVVSLKVFLEGPFDGVDLMNTNLNLSGQMPLSQPFFEYPWYYSGTESVTIIPNNQVVDWILIEYRQTAGNVTSATSNTRIGRKAGFILKDGSVVDTDGNSPLNFIHNVSDNLFVVVYHRNHLPVISANPVTLNNGAYNYDFASDPQQTYGGSSAVHELVPGIWGLIAADGNGDTQINNLDKNDVWSNQAGNSGYLRGDFNLDTQVNNTDKNDLWNPNTGQGGQVPD
ncbi:MAG: hypothetical protein JXA03_09835 [Bacteroidales bacterium]|nr:hypothetical protein [Bacteroidales bacterium]